MVSKGDLKCSAAVISTKHPVCGIWAPLGWVMEKSGVVWGYNFPVCWGLGTMVRGKVLFNGQGEGKWGISSLRVWAVKSVIG